MLVTSSAFCSAPHGTECNFKVTYIARQWLAKNVPESYAVNENRCLLLDNGFGYHGIAGVSGTTQT
jgi:hypothetical protein